MNLLCNPKSSRFRPGLPFFRAGTCAGLLFFLMTGGLLLFPAVAALAQHGHHHHEQEQPQQAQQTDRGGLSELEALYWQRLDASRQNFVQADVDFMTDMIVHHAQALIMSRLSPANGASPAVQRLSARIINAQQDEIALMQQWLRDRARAVPLVHFEGIEMHVSMEQPAGHSGNAPHQGHDHASEHHSGHEAHHQTEHEQHQQQAEGHEAHHPANEQDAHAHHGHGHNHDDMPGMLTQAQLEELAAARDSEFDRLFLTYMIEHHEGAVYMVNELFMADGAGTDLESYRLAVDIYAEQVTEIAMMRQMLERMGFDVPEPLRELQEQQARLRNPQSGSGSSGEADHHHHHETPAAPENRHGGGHHPHHP